MYIDYCAFGVSEDWDHPETSFKMPGFISRSALPSLSNSLLPFIESPYYYCHYKGLDLSIAKSEIPLFPPPREDLYGFFHCFTDFLSLWWLLFCSSSGMVCELGKEGFIFRFIPAACAARTGSLLPRLLALPSFPCTLTVSTCGETRIKGNLNFGSHGFGL